MIIMVNLKAKLNVLKHMLLMIGDISLTLPSHVDQGHANEVDTTMSLLILSVQEYVFELGQPRISPAGGASEGRRACAEHHRASE